MLLQEATETRPSLSVDTSDTTTETASRRVWEYLYVSEGETGLKSTEQVLWGDSLWHHQKQKRKHLHWGGTCRHMPEGTVRCLAAWLGHSARACTSLSFFSICCMLFCFSVAGFSCLTACYLRISGVASWTYFTQLTSDSWLSKDWMFCPERRSHTLTFLSQPW